MNNTPPSSLFITPTTDDRGRSLNEPLFQNNRGSFTSVPVSSNNRSFVATTQSANTRLTDLAYINQRYTTVSPLDENRPAEYSSPPKVIAVNPRPQDIPSQVAPIINVNKYSSPSVASINTTNEAGLQNKQALNSKYNQIDRTFIDTTPFALTPAGTSDTGLVNNFFANLNTWQGSIPLQHFWVVQFMFSSSFYTAFNKWYNNIFGSQSGDGLPWGSSLPTDAASMLVSAGQQNSFQGKQITNSSKLVTGCYFARSINIPGEKIDILNPSIPGAGGLYFHNVLNKRQAPTNLQISFMETNASFVDLFLRPWSVLASHIGSIARDPTNSLKVNIEATFYAKSQYNSKRNSGGNINSESPKPYTRASVSKLPELSELEPQPRKKFLFEAAMPLTINNQEYTYVGEALQIRPVDFIYESYKVDTYSGM